MTAVAPDMRADHASVLSATCFHCGEPLRGSVLTAKVEGRVEPVCCMGCLAVTELIAVGGFADYYRLREAAGARPNVEANSTDTWSALSDPVVAAQFTDSSGEIDSATLAIDGLRCAACSWLIDRVLRAAPGVLDASTNCATGRLHVSWRRGQFTLADVVRRIVQLGYKATPLNDASTLILQQQERRDALKRLAAAGFGMMQVMMFAVADYSARLSGEVVDPGLLEFFRVVSLLVTTPVLLYSAAPVFIAAGRSLRTRAIGMDLPVAIALLLAYVASLWNTLMTAGAEVYFDAVTMFIFFLTLSRWVQMTVRHRTTSITDALARQLPSCAHRIFADTLSDVPIASLNRGDVILVRRGEVLPADGDLIDTEASIDESILTGESTPVAKRSGQRLSAGTLNIGNPVRVTVTAATIATTLSHIVALLQRASAQRPRQTRVADAAATHFLTYVLIGAALTCATWLVVDPSRAFAVTLSVLVVACPCAFAIATPAAVSAATTFLARAGVLVTRIDAIETLARVDHVVFDKTGTLTRGDISVARCVVLGDLSEERCLEVAASLEVASEHPLARAFAGSGEHRHAEAMQCVPGAGIEGVIDGRRYRIGTIEFVADLLRKPIARTIPQECTGTIVALGDEQCALALFELRDVPRSSAVAAVASLKDLGITTQILSGDTHTAVADVADRCGIIARFGRRSPEQKLAHVQDLQRLGHRVAMVGDGVNDAPVLAAADLSIAMGGGAALAHASADMILVGENLDSLPRAIRLARRARRIALQNLIWSAIYNFGSLPLAAAGLIPPWLAAAGMSLSSIAVVLNASRLLPRRRGQAASSVAAKWREAPVPWNGTASATHSRSSAP